MRAGDVCARCGHNPAEGRAFIGNERYCHGESVAATCYERETWDRADRAAAE